MPEWECCPADLEDFSGRSWTLMNLKFPIRPWHLPFQRPEGFIVMTSMVSPRYEKTEGRKLMSFLFTFFPSQQGKPEDFHAIFRLDIIKQTLNLRASLSYGLGV